MSTSKTSTTKRTSLIGCFGSLQLSDEFKIKKDSNIPVVALVNGLSGGHKGEKVIRILHKMNIPAFNLILLSSDKEYFKQFCHVINEMYEDIIFEEMHRRKNGETDIKLQPRILIAGGDGTIAWAVSVLDRAFVHDEMLRNLWRRMQLIQGIQENKQEITLPVSRRISLKSSLSADFYYSNNNQAANNKSNSLLKKYVITPTNNSNATTNDSNLSNNIDINIDVQVSENNVNPSALPYIDVDLQIFGVNDIDEYVDDEKNDEKNNDDNDCSQYSSSASLSGRDASKVVQEFMNEELSTKSSPTKFNRLKAKKENKEKLKVNENENQYDDAYDDDLDEDSLSESLVTREEFASCIRQKEEEALFHQKQSIDELRILQTIYDDKCIGPIISLLPLGTGNDLSRCLGTGTTYPGSKYLRNKLISDYKTYPITKLDRWKIEFRENNNEQTLKTRQCSEMLCYFSIGVEGQITYRFQQARNKNPKIFDRPWKNKIQYVLSGISAGVDEVFGITKPLNDIIELYVDDKKLKLPSKTRSIIISNIQSMADGVYCWGKGPSTKKDTKNCTQPRLGDGKLEIMSSKGLYKYLQMRVGISHYRRLAQSKKVTFIMKNELPIQCDGESWIETPGIINIYLLHQVFAVVGDKEPRGVKII